MNYRHIYHAGNFADVLKHVILITLLQALQRKESPLCFLDTHAGIGLYELQSIQSQKKQEYLSGIAALFFKDKSNMPPVIARYISMIENINPKHELLLYPGSPLIAHHLLRAQDQMILCELHPEDCIALKENLPKQSTIAIHHQDAYVAMKAFLPPKLKRGLVLIDPPFEVTDEFERVFHALQQALKHWRAGHFMVWYPIKNKSAVTAFYRALKTLKTPQLIIHFGLNTEIKTEKLSECGIVLVNPPWQTKELLCEILLPYLAEQLNGYWQAG